VTDKAYFDRAIELVGLLLSPAQIAVLKFALSLHVYSPRVEMFSQIAGERNIVCPVAADVGGTIVCTVDELKSSIKSSLVSAII
jgi:UDP-glucose:glycoprotein glucosyltransferase